MTTHRQTVTPTRPHPTRGPHATTHLHLPAFFRSVVTPHPQPVSADQRARLIISPDHVPALLLTPKTPSIARAALFSGSLKSRYSQGFVFLLPRKTRKTQRANPFYCLKELHKGGTPRSLLLRRNSRNG